MTLPCFVSSPNSTVVNSSNSSSSSSMSLLKKNMKKSMLLSAKKVLKVDSLSDSSDSAWNCSACTFSNKASDTKCLVCGTTKKGDLDLDNNLAPCPACTFHNKASATACTVCQIALFPVTNTKNSSNNHADNVSDTKTEDNNNLAVNVRAYKVSTRMQGLLNHKHFADVTFKVGNEVLYGHRAVIAARCPALAARLYPADKSLPGQVEITLVTNSKAFLELLRFLYCDIANVTDDTVFDVVILAKEYHLGRLLGKCGSCLKRALATKSPREVCEQYEKMAAYFVDVAPHLNAYETFIRVNAASIITPGNLGWLKLKATSLRALLSGPALEIEESVLLSAVLAWSEYQTAQSRAQLRAVEAKMPDAMIRKLFTVEATMTEFRSLIRYQNMSLTEFSAANQHKFLPFELCLQVFKFLSKQEATDDKAQEEVEDQKATETDQEMFWENSDRPELQTTGHVVASGPTSKWKLDVDYQQGALTVTKDKLSATSLDGVYAWILGTMQMKTGKKSYSWAVDVKGLNGWLLLGVSSKIKFTETTTHSHPSVFGWSSKNQQYTGGYNSQTGSCVTGWGTQVLHFKLDKACMLTVMWLDNMKQVKTITIGPVPKNTIVVPHLNLHASNCTVTCLPLALNKFGVFSKEVRKSKKGYKKKTNKTKKKK